MGMTWEFVETIMISEDEISGVETVVSCGFRTCKLELLTVVDVAGSHNLDSSLEELFGNSSRLFLDGFDDLFGKLIK